MEAGGSLGAAVVAAIAVVGAALVTTIGAVIVKVLDRRRAADAPLQDSSPTLALLALQDAIKQRDAVIVQRDELRELADRQRDELEACHDRLDDLGLS